MKTHAKWAMELQYLQQLLILGDSDDVHLRLKASVCIARLCNALQDDEYLKKAVEPYIAITAGLSLISTGESGGGGMVSVPAEVYPTATGASSTSLHVVELLRRRAILECALFTCTRDDVAVWALQQASGVPQLLMLVGSGDSRCQEVASEVLCLAAASENGSGLLSSLLSSGALQTLLRSPVQSVRAAAASAMTKLSIKAKAVKEGDESPELSDILNTVLLVLKTSPLSTLKQPTSNEGVVTENGHNSEQKVSFSKLSSFDNSFTAQSGSATSQQQKQSKQIESNKLRLHDGISTSGHNSDPSVSGASIVSTERAIEVLASLVGRTFIKEEVVHGSYRSYISIYVYNAQIYVCVHYHVVYTLIAYLVVVLSLF